MHKQKGGSVFPPFCLCRFYTLRRYPCILGREFDADSSASKTQAVTEYDCCGAMPLLRVLRRCVQTDIRYQISREQSYVAGSVQPSGVPIIPTMDDGAKTCSRAAVFRARLNRTLS